MNQIFLGQPSEKIKKWFVETFPSWPAYTTLEFVNGTTQTKEISGAATWQNIGVKRYEYSDNNTLKSCQLGNKVTEVSSRAFSSCRSLTSINIPNSVALIRNNAFSNCSLISVNIPSSVTSIGIGAFGSNPSLTSITVDPNNPNYDSRYNCNAIIETSSNTLIHGCNNTIIPSSVSEIRDFAFSYCSSLTSINIPNSVTLIRSGAFYGCSALTSITIPNSVTSIGEESFYQCFSLTSVNIPNSVKTIRNHLFCGCRSLTSITFNSIIETLEQGALSGNVNLLSVIGPLFPSKGLMVNNIESGVFRNCESLKQIYIDLDYISSIGYDAFGGCSSLTSIFFVTGQGATLAKISSMANYPFGADPSIIKMARGEPT